MAIPSSPMECPLEELISAARGEIEADLIIEGAEVLNVFSGELHRSDLAIYKGRVVSFHPVSARGTLDLSGTLLAPGFIDGHVHIESAMVTVPEYARAVVPRGTTSVVIDPHEIANVMGMEGIRYMLGSSSQVPMNVFIMLPSCVPVTNFETSGASLNASDLSGFIDNERVLGLAEVMNYPGVIFKDPAVLEKIRLADGKRIDGHAPGLKGRDLNAYAIAGIGSDHECTMLDEAREKLRLGMHIMIQEGSAAKNLGDLLPLITPKNARNFIFVSDDRHPPDILSEGHNDFSVRTSVQMGLDPVLALQIASLNAAQYFRIPWVGALAPGYRADIAVLNNLEDISVLKVFKDGRLVAEGGKLTVPLPNAPAPEKRSMNIRPVNIQSFNITAESGLARVIGVVPDQIVTRMRVETVKAVNGVIVADIERDILKMAVLERHRASGNIGLGLVSGFGLKSGAIATSVAHDSHNIAVVGTRSEDMLSAAQAIEKMGGGLVVVDKSQIKAMLPLPIAGLISDRPMPEVAEGVEEVTFAAKELGCSLKDPFMTLSFLCLPVIPELKLTDKGLVDVNRFEIVPLFLREN
jgi:adenine deaminase